MDRDDATFLDLLLASRRAVEGLGDLTSGALADDWKTQSIVLHQLLVLGEGVKRLSSEFRDKHSTMPWRRIAGLRDILIHCYDTVDVEAVCEIVNRDLPPLIAFLESVAPRFPDDGDPLSG